MIRDEVENKKQSSSMKPRAQPVNLNSYRTISLNPPYNHRSKSHHHSQTHKDNRMLTSPAPFSNLTSDVLDHGTFLQRSPTSIDYSTSRSSPSHRLNGYLSLPHRLSINRRRRKESQITFQQESTSEISLPTFFK
ncbi:hypothetical protein DFH28DRAFT_1121017 [Melampsora americana]|nr:hypothetical protein DFH28DRAFT_1121017 [Melampsora americana]